MKYLLLLVFLSCGKPQHDVDVAVWYINGDTDTMTIKMAKGDELWLEEGDLQKQNTGQFTGSGVWRTFASGVRRYKIIKPLP